MTVTRVVYPGGDPTDKFQIGCFFKMLMYSYPAREEELIREFDLDKGAWEKDGYAFVGIPLGRARTLFRAVSHNAPEDIRRMFQMGFVSHATRYIHALANNLKEMEPDLAGHLHRHAEQLDEAITRRSRELFGLSTPHEPNPGEREQRHIDLEDEG